MYFEKNGITEGTSWDTLRIYFQKNVWIVLVMIIKIPLLTKHSFIKSVLAKLCLKLCCFWFWCWYWPCCSSTLCCLHWLLSMSCMGVNITWSVTPSIALCFFCIANINTRRLGWLWNRPSYHFLQRGRPWNYEKSNRTTLSWKLFETWN